MEQVKSLGATDVSENDMPVYFRMLFGLFLVFSLFSIYIYYISNSLSEAQLAALPEPGRQLYLDIPVWAIISGAMAGVFSLIGLALAIAGKKKAIGFLALAFLCVLLRDGWFIYDGRVWDLISRISLILSSSFVIVFAVQLYSAIHGARKGWLR